MTEEIENLILRLLRDTRAKQGEHDARFDRIEARVGTVERRMVDVQESVATAAGFSASANAPCAMSGQKIDRLFKRVDRPEARIQELETET